MPATLVNVSITLSCLLGWDMYLFIGLYNSYLLYLMKC